MLQVILFRKLQVSYLFPHQQKLTPHPAKIPK